MDKVLLIPPVINPFFEDKNFLPLGLLAIAATLRKNEYFPSIYRPKIRIITVNDYNTIAKDILSKKPQIIGFSTWCINYPASLLVAQQIKIEAPEITIVFGGPQASILSKETLQNFWYIDFILAGEADFSFPFFIKELNKKQPNLKQIPGLTYRTISGQIVQNQIDSVIENLDDLPVPAYDLIPDSKTLKLDVGRGCPFKCTYCTTNNFFSKKYRVKSVNRILHEMNFAFTQSNINKFSFAHDMFTLHKKFINELCTALINQQTKSGVNFTWTCSARTDCVTKEMLVQMQQAGCESVFFGIESGSEKIQNCIGKKLEIGKVHELATICREAGINMHASFIIGFPDESKEDVEKSLKCALKLATKGALVQFSELSLLPGTPLFDKYCSALKFDGLFSNFSETFCGYEELKLILKYPQIFSSFYYLPVKTLNHREMSFLCHLINSMSHFRNTLFILRDIIETDIKKKNLLKLFKTRYKTISSDELSNTPIVSHWIKFLRTYILDNKNRISDQSLNDVFTFEAFQALILARFNRWQTIKPQLNVDNITEHPEIMPSPSWNILSTSYKLNKIMCFENEWGKIKTRKKRGHYTYLVIAVSPVKCRRIQINKTDEYLLKNLSECDIDDFISKVGNDIKINEVFNWLKKMKKLGVIEISSKMNKTKSESTFA